MTKSAVDELASRFITATKLQPAKVVQTAVTDAISGLLVSVKADGRAVNTQIKNHVAQRGGMPMPLAFFNVTEEAAFLSGAPGGSDAFPVTADADFARFETPMSGGAGHKKVSLPREIIASLRCVPGARETLADALALLVAETKEAGAATKATFAKSSLKKSLKRK